MAEYYLSSPQTYRTKAVRDFADKVAPFPITRDVDLLRVVDNVRRALPFRSSQATIRSVNADAMARYHSALEQARAEGWAERNLPLSALAGVRSAHEIVTDRFVTMPYGCTDLATVVMAVLRHKGVPCRFGRITVPDKAATTSVVEVPLGRSVFLVRPLDLDPRKRVVMRSLDEDRPDQQVAVGKDHWDTGVDEHELFLGLKAKQG